MIARALVLACLAALPARADTPSSAIAFDSPAADAFLQGLYSRVLQENYRTEHHAFVFANPDELQLMSRSFNAMRSFVATKVQELCLTQGRAARTCERGADSVKRAWIDRGSGDVASREFALWFYKLDGENWFSYEDMHKEAQAYLERNQTELFMVRGFRARGVLADALVVEDLPVVVNFNENTLSFWINQLED